MNDGLFGGFTNTHGSAVSPAMYAQGISSPDFNSLLESFTNTQYAGEETIGSYQQHPGPGYHGQQRLGDVALPHDDFAAGSKYGEDPSADRSFFGSTGQNSVSHSYHGGLRIHRDHVDLPMAPPPSSYLTEQPTPNTVSRLEEAAAHHASTSAHQSYTGGIGRQSRSSTLSDGVHMGNLSLDSPRHSLSTSSASSSQNSPTTPISAHSLDASASFSAQQQRSMSGLQQAFAATKTHGSHSQQGTLDLSASLPPSLLHQGQYQYPHYPLAAVNPISRSVASLPLVPSPSRMSSAGLMDQVVSSRRALASPLASEMESFPAMSSSQQRVGKKHTRSRSGISTSPPLTPARGSLRSSRRSGAQPSDADSTPIGYEPAPSRAGPHRTPVKAASGTPKRPDLRRTASHTPHGSRTSSPSLISPAQSDAIRGPLLASMSNSAHLARITGGGVGLDFAGGSSMTRAASSPGWAASSTNAVRSASSSSSQASSTSGGQHSRRSSQASALLMSPLTHGGSASAPAATAATSQLPISRAEALQAVAHLRMYLAQQAVILQTIPPQSAATVIGTYEQAQAVEDLYRRLQARHA